MCEVYVHVCLYVCVWVSVYMCVGSAACIRNSKSVKTEMKFFTHELYGELSSFFPAFR